MSSEEIAIRVSNLSKRYEIYDTPRDRLMQFVLPRLYRMARRPPKQYFHEFWALRDVSFEVKKGETVGIIGRNGSGKSTLLQMICGTLNPTMGDIQTKGRIAALLELGSGFNPEFTGRENIYMNGAVLGLTKEEITSRFPDIAEFADIGTFIEQPLKTYSSGMLVRLAFAVAINVDPQILIVDEALAVGDELFQRKCFSRIEGIKKYGATILFVSHSASTVVELCDNALLLDTGEKLAIGNPKSIVGKYQKLIYAPEDERSAIRDKIREYNRKWHDNEEHYKSSPTTGGPIRIKNSVDCDQVDFFDPNLKPQSTLEYESHGVYIFSPQILTLTGRKVNFLTRGKNYLYRYDVSFHKRATNVRFGMLIKTISGLELGGAVSAPSIGKGISHVAEGTTIEVEFRFACNLNPGSYFLNAGVTGTMSKEETFLHRVLDITMFKVRPITDNTATAIIDFDCTIEFRLKNNHPSEFVST